jgi:uncharacterized protein YciI
MDRSGVGDQRNAFRDAHRAYLKPFAEPGKAVRILQAGPMCASDTDDTNLGSFMIVDAPSAKAVRRFHDDDPFTKAGIYGEFQLLRWDRHIHNPEN